MTIDSNLLLGLEYGFGAGLGVGLIVAGVCVYLISRSVKLSW